MMKNIENTENIHLLQSHINGLRAENEILRDENETLFETNEALIKTIRDLRAKVSNLESDNIRLTNQNLIGNMTASDIAEQEFICAGEAHYADTWNINCGDDF